MNPAQWLLPAAQAVGETIVIPETLDIPASVRMVVFASFICALLMLAVIGALIVLVVRSRAKARERIVTLAIQAGQPEVAKAALYGRRSHWLLYIVLGIVAIVFVANAPIWASVLMVALVTVTASAWLPFLTRDKAPRETAQTSTQPPSTPPPAPPAHDDET